MDQTKTLVLKKEIAIVLIQFAILLGIAILAPLLGHQQFITGTIVNATLFISAGLLGGQAAILIGLVPSVIALSFGLLPAVLAPLVPFIMLSNTILVLTFICLKDKNYWLRVIPASLLKYLFLFATSSIVINLLLKKEVTQKVAAMMSWPQLVTALLGGILAYLFLKGLKNIR